MTEQEEEMLRLFRRAPAVFRRNLIELLKQVPIIREIGENRCQHRDDGRGRCIDCGDFLPSYWSPDRED